MRLARRRCRPRRTARPASVSRMSPSSSSAKRSSCSALAHRQQLVGLQLQRAGQRRQVGAAVVRRRGQRLHQAGQQVGGDRMQRGREGDVGGAGAAGGGAAAAPARGGSSARRCRPPSGGTPGPGGCADAGTAPSARCATRPGLEENTRMRSHISTASSMLCVTIRIDLTGSLPSDPQVDQVGAQRLGGQHVERARTARPSAAGRDAPPARGPGRRAGACRRTVPSDRRSRSRRGRSGRSPPRRAARARRAATPCASSPSSTFSCTVSQGNSAKLWNTMATPGAGPVDRLRRASCTSPGGRRQQAGDDAQQRRLAGAGAAEQADDLAARQRAG